ncbi:P-loop containing nucleoside triphosphate hydrolase protein [Dipodascopsis uninucleata]
MASAEKTVVIVSNNRNVDTPATTTTESFSDSHSEKPLILPTVVCQEEIKPSISSLYKFSRKLDHLILLCALLSTSLLSVTPVALSIVLGRIVSSYSQYGQESESLVKTITPYLWALFLISIAGFFGWTGLYFFWGWFTERQMENARTLLVDAIMSKEASWYDALESPGALSVRCQKHFEDYRSGMSDNIGRCLFYIGKFILSFVLALYYSWQLTLIILITIPILMVIGITTSKPINVSIAKEKDVSVSTAKVVDWAISNIQTVKLFNGQTTETRKFKALSKASSRLMQRLAFFYATQQSLCKFFVLVMFIQGFWYGSHLVRQGKITSGHVMTVFWSCNILSHSVQHLAPQFISLAKAKLAAESLSSIINDSQTRKRPTDGLTKEDIRGVIEFKDVSFAYPTRPNVLVLQNVSFCIPEYQMTFIVGESGSGKSTLHSLILDLYKPLTGTITIDDTDVLFLSHSWLRRQITVVQQDCVLFRDTIANNIRLGSERPELVDDSTLKEAIQMSMLLETLNDFSEYENTLLDASGKDLSGGQRQRVALARAKIRDSHVLILDEATSALDIVSRGLILDAIRVWRKGKTTIIITHEISQIGHEDNVVVFKDGCVVQQGIRDHLQADIYGPFMDLMYSSANESESPEFQHILETSKYPPKSSRLSKVLAIPEFSHTITTSKNAFYDYYDDFSVRNNLKDRWSSISLGNWHNDLSSTSRWSNYDVYRYRGENMALLAGDTSRRARLDHQLRTNCLVRSGYNSETTSPVVDEFKERDIKANSSVDADVSYSRFLTIIFYSHTRKWNLTFGLITAICNGATMPAFSYTFSKLLYSTFSISSARGIKWPLIVLVVAIADFLTSYLSIFVLETAGERWIYRLRNLAFRNVLHKEYSWFSQNCSENADSDKIVSRDLRSANALSQVIVNDSEEMRILTGKFVGKVLAAVVMSLVGIIWALTLGWQLTLVGLSLGPLAYGSSRIFAKVSNNTTRSYRERADEFGDTIYEVTTSIRTVKVLVLENHFMHKCMEKSLAVKRAALHQSLYLGGAAGLNDIAEKLMETILFYYGAVLISDGRYSVSQVITVFTLVVFSSFNASVIVSYLPHLDKAKASALKLLSLCSESSSDCIESTGEYSPVRERRGSRIEFRNINFSYRGRDFCVLTDISLIINPGETVAIVGSSGCGKTTLVNMVTRLLMPSSGTIEIDGVDIKDINLRALRRDIAVVTQNSCFFDDSIYNNLIYGLASNEVTLTEVEEACMKSGVYDFISSLPDGFDTHLSGSAQLISGGQAQRIAIARALIRKPRILILDECTSALDALSARHVRSTIVQLQKMTENNNNYMPTVIIVTHSQEMMEHSQRVIVMDSGRIIETGRYSDLIKIRNGHLVNLISGGEWE